MAVMMRTILDVADNSGARRLQMILPLGGHTGLNAGLGDVVTAAVKEAAPDGTAKKGTMVKCVIVRQRKEQGERHVECARYRRAGVHHASGHGGDDLLRACPRNHPILARRAREYSLERQAVCRKR